MVKTIALALALAMGVVACKGDAPGPTAASQTIIGVGDVRIVSTQLVSSTDGATTAGGGLVTYLITRLELTNSGQSDFTPEISRFIFTDKDLSHYSGVDSGSSVLTGISNSSQPLKKGEKREYTVAFRSTDQIPSGQVAYEP